MKKIIIIGNGNWGTTAAKLIAENITKHNNKLKNTTDYNEEDLFDNQLLLHVHEEIYQNQKLSEYINAFHSNPIYLPNIILPENVIAVTDIACANTADIIVVCLPHQFLDTVKAVQPKKGAFAVNLSKGFVVQDNQLYMPSKYINKLLCIDCCCLQGANIASEVAAGCLSESTVGYVKKEQSVWLERMFSSDYFSVKTMPYKEGIEVSGGVKNIISFAVGIAIGLGCGANTVAMIFRRGLLETQGICKLLETECPLLESCCVGDLLCSCLEGRNYKVGAEMGRSSKTVEELEKSLGGQKLQGPNTAKAVFEWLQHKKAAFFDFPLIEAVYKICYCNENCDFLLSILKN